MGFPNKIVDDRILRLVSKSYDKFLYSEERRLFYVALTRTKNKVYLLVPKKNPSIFIKNLFNWSYNFLNDGNYIYYEEKVNYRYTLLLTHRYKEKLTTNFSFLLGNLGYYIVIFICLLYNVIIKENRKWQRKIMF